MLRVISFLIISSRFCNSQEFNSSIIETDEEDTSCIGKYIDLEKYVLNNENLLEKLAETFFTTGKAASNFVKVTYNFQTSNGKQSENDNITNCSSQQNTYIWSEAALYLLGPRALYWCTLFAVDLHEVDVTIELPCLCSEAYNSLLSRLTYLVCICYNNKLCIRI